MRQANFFLCAFPALREPSGSFDEYREANADDAAVFRGQTKEMFAGVLRVVRGCSPEGNAVFVIRGCLPKSVDLYPGGYNEAGIKIGPIFPHDPVFAPEASFTSSWPSFRRHGSPGSSFADCRPFRLSWIYSNNTNRPIFLHEGRKGRREIHEHRAGLGGLGVKGISLGCLL